MLRLTVLGNCVLSIIDNLSLTTGEPVVEELTTIIPDPEIQNPSFEENNLEGADILRNVAIPGWSALGYRYHHQRKNHTSQPDANDGELYVSIGSDALERDIVLYQEVGVVQENKRYTFKADIWPGYERSGGTISLEVGNIEEQPQCPNYRCQLGLTVAAVVPDEHVTVSFEEEVEPICVCGRDHLLIDQGIRVTHDHSRLT